MRILKQQGENIPRMSGGHTRPASLATARQTCMSEWSCEETSSQAPGRTGYQRRLFRPLVVLEIGPLLKSDWSRAWSLSPSIDSRRHRLATEIEVCTTRQSRKLILKARAERCATHLQRDTVPHQKDSWAEREGVASVSAGSAN